MRIVSLVRPEYGGSSAGSTVRALLAVRLTVLLAVLLLAASPTPAI